jgi:hypothetical protein
MHDKMSIIANPSRLLNPPSTGRRRVESEIALLSEIEMKTVTASQCTENLNLPDSFQRTVLVSIQVEPAQQSVSNFSGAERSRI